MLRMQAEKHASHIRDQIQRDHLARREPISISIDIEDATVAAFTRANLSIIVKLISFLSLLIMNNHI